VGDFQHSTTLERLLDLVRQDHLTAREELIEHALGRLRMIARRMFRRLCPARNGGALSFNTGCRNSTLSPLCLHSDLARDGR
jgi:hypothetical protein